LSGPNPGPDYELQNLLELSNSQNIDRLQQQARVLQMQDEVSLAKAERWSGLTLSADYSKGEGADPEKVYGLGLSFPIPILNFNSNAIQAASKQVQAEQHRQVWMSQKVAQEIKSALQYYNAAKLSIQQLNIADLPKYEKEMRSVDQHFKKGQVDLLTYIEADAEHFESLNAILQAQVEFIHSKTAIEELVGRAPEEQ